MVLPLADIRQTKNWTCGHAALLIAWEFFGCKSRPVPATPVDGTSPDLIETLLWQSGLTVQSGSMDIEDLRYHTKRGRPVICAVTEPSGIGHWIVVAGFQRRTHEGKRVPHIRFQCPTDGPCVEPVEQFEARWTDATRRGVVYACWGIAVGS